MNQAKWKRICLLMVVLLTIGWVFQVRGEESVLQIGFIDESDAMYFSKSRVLEIKLPEGQEQEVIHCEVNQEESDILWDDSGTGRVSFEEIGKYEVVVWQGEEEVFSSGFCIDLIPPTVPKVSFDDYKEGTWTKHDISMKVSGSECFSGIQKYEYRLEGSGWKTAVEGKIFLQESMNGYIEMRGVSNAGLKSEVTRKKIMLWKKQPKNIGLMVEQPNEHGWHTKEPNLTVKEYDQGKGPKVTFYIEVIRGDGEHKLYTNKIPSLTKDGKYILSWWTEDELGHISEIGQKKNVLIDQTSPEIVVTGNIKGEFYRNQKQKIQIAFQDAYLNQKKTEVTTTGEKGENQEGIEVIFQDDGEHTCQIVAVDEAGNQSKESIDSFVLDQTKPQIQVSGVKALHSYRKAVRPKITWSDKNIDMSKCKVWLNQKEVKHQGKETLGLEVTKDAHHVITVKGKDFAGNEVTDTVPFTVNQKGSTIRLLTKHLVGEKINHKQVKIKFQVDNIDPYVVETFQLNERDVAFQQEKNIVTMTQKLSQDGRYHISFSVKDMSGNQDTFEEERSFYYDGTPPELLILGVENGKTYEESKEVQIKTQKKNDKIIQLKINGKEQKGYSNNEKYRFKRGKYHIEVKGKEEVGNIANKDISFQIKEKKVFFEMQEPIQRIQEKVSKENKSPVVFVLFSCFLLFCSGLLFFRKKKR